MEKIAEVGTFLFDDYLILGLSKKWLQLLGETPKFEALIDKKGKLILRSTTSIPNTKSILYSPSTKYTPYRKYRKYTENK
jgi:hypothetical protein